MSTGGLQGPLACIRGMAQPPTGPPQGAQAPVYVAASRFQTVLQGEIKRGQAYLRT